MAIKYENGGYYEWDAQAADWVEIDQATYETRRAEIED